MAAKRRLLGSYADPHWAMAFVEGRIRFWSLSYFRDVEERQVRGDSSEGTGVFAPDDGLQVTNYTQGTRFRMPAHALTSRAATDEIFVFCTSRELSDQMWHAFEAVVCVEIILDVPAFCARVAAALPAGAKFPGRPGRQRTGWRVDYYRPAEAPGTRWALPDQIAYLQAWNVTSGSRSSG